MEKSSDRLYCIVFYFIQFIALMIHLEILELNFCGLNKYTKRNIIYRGQDDILAEGRDSVMDGEGVIDIDKNYYIKGSKNKEITTELVEKYNPEECLLYKNDNINEF